MDYCPGRVIANDGNNGGGMGIVYVEGNSATDNGKRGNIVRHSTQQKAALLTVKNITTLEPIFAATVVLSNIGLSYDTTQYTNEKGQTYFIPLEVANYNLEIQAPGYLAISTTVLVSGDAIETVLLEQVE